MAIVLVGGEWRLCGCPGNRKGGLIVMDEPSHLNIQQAGTMAAVGVILGQIENENASAAGKLLPLIGRGNRTVPFQRP